MAEKTILDVCCGSKMFWFDRNDDRVIFCDKRAERYTLNDKTAKGGKRDLVIAPNIISEPRQARGKIKAFRVQAFQKRRGK